MKPIIVGEAPSKNEHPPSPIEGRIGHRLAACTGISFAEFLERFDRMNLLEVRQDTKEKGFEFDAVAASKSAERLWSNFQRGQIVLLLGKRVAKAFAVKGEYFVKQNVAGADVYVLPHPSGINRWWNDSRNGRRMYDFMQTLDLDV